MKVHLVVFSVFVRSVMIMHGCMLQIKFNPRRSSSGSKGRKRNYRKKKSCTTLLVL